MSRGGLRQGPQGDPLSPMLFVVALEALNAMIKAADNNMMQLFSNLGDKTTASRRGHSYTQMTWYYL